MKIGVFTRLCGPLSLGEPGLLIRLRLAISSNHDARAIHRTKLRWHILAAPHSGIHSTKVTYA